MELRHLHTFLAIADGLSFTRAASALGYAQSSVTAQVQSLEAELGVPLFERLGKRVTLTEAGHRLRPYAMKMIQLEQEARLAVPGRTEPSGTLHLGAPESLCAYRLPPLLARFRAQFPRVKLVFKPANCNELWRNVIEGSLDVAFFLDQETDFPALRTTALVTEPIRVLVSPDHPLARLSVVSPADLVGETILHTEEGCTYRMLFDRQLAEAGVRPEVAIEFTSLEAIKQSAIAGMGIAVLPEIAVEAEIALGRLVALKWHREDLSVLTQVAVHKDKWLSPTLAALLALVEDHFAAEAPVLVAR